MKEKLLSLASKREGGKWLDVVGEIPFAQVTKELLEADTFIFPSYTEAFPNVILEAMACGCAIASSNVGAIPEILDWEGETAGICFPAQSTEEVVTAINKLYSDEAYRTQLAEIARQKLYNTYMTENIWPQLINIWRTEDD